MGDAKIDMALDDIIKKNRGGPGNRRGRGNGVQFRQRGGNNQRGNRGGRIGKNNNNNRGRGGGNFRRGGGRNTFNQRNNNRSNNFRQQRGNGNSFPGFSRRKFPGDKPTATYNPLSRDFNASASKPKPQQQQQTPTAPRRQQGSIFNKIRPNQNRPAGNVGALRRRMLAAQHALNRATKTLAAMPRLKQQRQRFLQQPQQLRNIITRNKVAGGAVRKRLGAGPKTIGRGRGRRMFV